MDFPIFSRSFLLILWAQCVFFNTGILVFSIGIEVYQFYGVSGYSFLYLLMLVPGMILSKVIGKVIDKKPSFFILVTSIFSLLIISIVLYYINSMWAYYIFAFTSSILTQIAYISTSSAVSLATDSNKLAKAQGFQTTIKGLMYLGTPLLANTVLHYYDFNLLVLLCGSIYIFLILSSLLFKGYFNYSSRIPSDKKEVLPLNRLFMSILSLQISYVIVLTYFNSYALSSKDITTSNTVFSMIGIGGILGGILCYNIVGSLNKNKLLAISFLLIIISYLSSFLPLIIFIAPVALGIGYNLAFSLIRTHVKEEYRDSMIGTALGAFQYYVGLGSLVGYIIASTFPIIVSSLHISVALFITFLLCISMWLYMYDSNKRCEVRA